jgi:hypothetical protein
MIDLDKMSIEEIQNDPIALRMYVHGCSELDAREMHDIEVNNPDGDVVIVE